jgi:hypothetical protein
VVVVDVDTAKGGEIPAELPETPIVETGRGSHLYFALPPDVVVRNSVGKLAPNVDIRGEGGQVVFVGSLHPETGSVYRWRSGYSPDDLPLQPFPAHLIEVLQPDLPAMPVGTTKESSEPYVTTALRRELENVASAVEGQRNHTLNAAAYKLAGLIHTGHINDNHIRSELLQSALCCGLPSPEAAATIESGIRAGLASPRSIPEKDTTPEISRISNISRGAPVKNEFSPLPLRREPVASQPFPIGALGDVLGDAAQKLHEIVQAPDALCAQSLLAAAALAVQPYADIIIDGRVFPCSEYFLSIGSSGERKTATDTEALQPHREYEKSLADAYIAQCIEYEKNQSAYESAYRDAMKNATGYEAKRAALEALGDPPAPPLSPLLLYQEPTYEGIIKQLLQGLPSAGVFTDEAGRIIGGHAMNSENQMKTLAGLSELWNGKPISRVRSGDGAKTLYGRRFSIHLMMQPMVAETMLGNRIMNDQGFLSRCLMVWPTSTAGHRSYKELNICNDPFTQRYRKRMLDILSTDLPLAPATRNELKPRALPLSPAAKRIWVEFHDAIEKQLGEGQDLAGIRAFGNKAAEHAARLAGILTLVHDLGAPHIPAPCLEAGIELVQFYLGEQLRLEEAGASDPDIVLAEKLLRWAQERSDVVALVKIYQNGPAPIRDAATAGRIAALLEKHGWFHRVAGGTEVDGIHRRDVWRVLK